MKKLISSLAIMFLTAVMFVNFILPAQALPLVSVDAPILGKIFVENLDDLITEEDLTEVFTDYGVVENVSLPKDRGTGRNRGFGLVEMESEADEEAAIADLDGAEWYGQIPRKL